MDLAFHAADDGQGLAKINLGVAGRMRQRNKHLPPALSDNCSGVLTRSYDREDMVFDPIHYLPLLEHKIGALDQAAPLAGWELPDAFPTLRRLLEARMGKAGKREYVQVLRLVETFDLEVLHGAVKDALRLGAIGYDAVKHLVLCRIERRPPKLDLDIYPYLPRANVATTAAASYMSLLGGGAS